MVEDDCHRRYLEYMIKIIWISSKQKNRTKHGIGKIKSYEEKLTWKKHWKFSSSTESSSQQSCQNSVMSPECTHTFVRMINTCKFAQMLLKMCEELPVTATAGKKAFSATEYLGTDYCHP
ncbi:hypothetical protein H6P81_005048 [Aristolochia fimbriata]|uniref:HAT C-terminal dimerisation domain-containing protein n=1 Tax=Aristolochia fimbriata TaxID=158543 RepID=A0AAV7EU24_ARIFI|nr:hypothetical protein H6P81_005048 [Aristolochia fimbriata]